MQLQVNISFSSQNTMDWYSFSSHGFFPVSFVFSFFVIFFSKIIFVDFSFLILSWLEFNFTVDYNSNPQCIPLFFFHVCFFAPFHFFFQLSPFYFFFHLFFLFFFSKLLSFFSNFYLFFIFYFFLKLSLLILLFKYWAG